MKEYKPGEKERPLPAGRGLSRPEKHEPSDAHRVNGKPTSQSQKDATDRIIPRVRMGSRTPTDRRFFIVSIRAISDTHKIAKIL